MSASALRLFADLGITYVPPNEQRGRGPMATSCLGVVARLIRKFGLPHATITLRTIVESKGNESALIADIVDAVSDLIRAHPRWANAGLALIESFDQIDLAEVRKAAKATLARPLRAAITTLVCIQLTKILGPSRLPKPARPARVKSPPKLPRAVTRVHEVEKNVALGRELVTLRSQFKWNNSYSRALRARFPGLDPQLASKFAMVARAFGDKPPIYTRLSWSAVEQLASPTVASAVRAGLERRILAGERIGADDIRAACGKRMQNPYRRAAARPAHEQRKPDQPARMAA
jgi:hypothetical protein